MISVLLLILKIIGITLLAVLGLVLLLLVLILFAPIRYRAKGDYINQKPFFNVKVSWFLPGLVGKLRFEETLSYSIKWFGHIFVSDKKKASESNGQPEHKMNKQKRKHKKSNDVKENKKEEQKKASDFNELDKTETNVLCVEEEKTLSESKKDDNKSTTAEGYEVQLESVSEDLLEENSSRSDSINDQENADGFFDRIYLKVIQKPFRKISSFWQGIIRRIQNICHKIIEIFSGIFKGTIRIKDRISYYYRLWQKDATQKVWEDCKNRAIKLLRHIKPKKFCIDLHVGLDDPSTTGMIMGIWGMLYPIVGGTIHIVPEFEEQVLEGTFICKGRIRLFTVLLILLQFYRDKKLKKLIELVKKGGK